MLGSFVVFSYLLSLCLSSSSADGTKGCQLPPGSPVDCQIRYLFPANPSSSDVNFDCCQSIRLHWPSSAIHWFPVGLLPSNIPPCVRPHDMSALVSYLSDGVFQYSVNFSLVNLSFHEMCKICWATCTVLLSTSWSLILSLAMSLLHGVTQPGLVICTGWP